MLQSIDIHAELSDKLPRGEESLLLAILLYVGERTKINSIADLSSICSTCHNNNRQEANGIGSLRDKIGGEVDQPGMVTGNV